MTAKEISEAVVKDERTVQRWAKKTGDKLSSIAEKLSSVSKSGTPADYDLSETVAIIETGLGKNAAELYRQNAQQKNSVESVAGSSLTARDLEVIAGIVSGIMKNLDSRLSNIETRVEKRAALLPAPELAPRDRVNMIVRKHVENTGISYLAAWGELYRQFAYRTHSNPKASAKNRNMTVLEYIEAEEQIDILESVAMDLFGGDKGVA